MASFCWTKNSRKLALNANGRLNLLGNFISISSTAFTDVWARISTFSAVTQAAILFIPRLLALSQLSGFATVSKDMTSSSLIGLCFVRRYPEMPSAADVVDTLDRQALASILTAYGEERFARKIASAIVEARHISPITRTQQLANVVAGSSTLCWLLSCSILQAEKGI